MNLIDFQSIEWLMAGLFLGIHESNENANEKICF